VHEIVGDLAEQIVGVEVESLLRPVPAHVAVNGNFAGSTTEERHARSVMPFTAFRAPRSEEHTSELQSLRHIVCRLLLEKKNKPGTSALTCVISRYAAPVPPRPSPAPITTNCCSRCTRLRSLARPSPSSPSPATRTRRLF